MTLNRDVYSIIRRSIPIGSVRRLPRLIADRAKAVPFLARVALDRLFKSYPAIVYVGDSHAYAFCSPVDPSPESIESLVRVGPGECLCWIGPRLLHSVGQKGIPGRALSALERLNPSDTVLVWFLGEIDIRVFGTSRYASRRLEVVSVVERFIQRINSELPAFGHVLTIPTAPSDVGTEDPALPRAGTLEERLAVFESFVSEIGNNGRLPVFNPNTRLRGRVLSPLETRDGTHFNFKYSLKARRDLHLFIRRARSSAMGDQRA